MSDGQEVRVRTQEEIDQAVQQLPWLQRTAWNLTPRPLQRMFTGQPAPVIRPPDADAQGIRRAAPQIYSNVTSIPRDVLNTFSAFGAFLQGQDPNSSNLLGNQIFGSPRLLPSAGGQQPARQRGYTDVRGQQEEIPAGLTASEWLGQNVGSFDETPYRNYMDFLATQDAETMARINALYNELAGEAQANMERIRDIYGSAQMTSGDVYGSAAQNIEGAYGSAQQQAADQMARLGIEAAAPAVINPMALSQAEAVAGVESAGAGALDALTRYGASAQDFGSQMGQVAQQQGLEVSNQILRDMAQRQAEAMFQMEQARANFNPYVNAMQQLEFEQMYNEPMLRGAEANMEAMQRAAELQLDTTLSRQDKILRIWTDIREDYGSDEEAWQAAVVAVQQAEAMYPIQ